MELQVETLDRKQAILIVSQKRLPLVDFLREELKKYNAEIFFSPELPKDIENFDYCFLINIDDVLKKISRLSYKKISLIFLNKSREAEKLSHHNLKNVKIINILGELTKRRDVENVLWFSFSQTGEHYLRLVLPLFGKIDDKPAAGRLPHFNFHLSKKRLGLIIILIVVFLNISFIFPLFFSSLSLYSAALALKKGDFNKTNRLLSSSQTSLKWTKKLYGVSRPTLLFFSVAIGPDNIININEYGQEIIQEALLISQDAKEIFKLILQKEKTAQEETLLSLRLERLRTEIDKLEENLRLLGQKVPTGIPQLQRIKQMLIETDETMARLKKITPYFDSLFAKDTQRKYLLLFANNRELRPGGGFIGSFGILTLKDFTLEDLKIYDVYDADGQLVAHIEPPAPIKEYLQQFHWFLRDSAFSPDFLENYAQAKFFLEKEMGFNDFSGGILLTTTAIENLLEAFGDIYLPDLKETINYKNFYLKTQIHAEKDFFPGSIQKKSFLSSLTRVILMNLESASTQKLITGLKASLDKKQIVVYFDEPQIQDVIDKAYWSGRVIDAQCPDKVVNCTVDYLFPYDANLGANKANFFISHQNSLRINIDSDGTIHHLLKLKFKNDSPADTFPGGNYHNYFQLLLPLEAKIKMVTKNDVLVEKIDETQEEFKKIGFLLDIPPKSTVEVKVDYLLEDKIKKGRNIYQLIVQKQIGSFDNDFGLELSLPKNVYLLNQNFSPLVKDDLILYNTILSSDKIFFIELIKD